MKKKNPPEDPPKEPEVLPEVLSPDVGDLRKVARRERPDEFGASGQGRVAVYQGERPATDTAAALAPTKPEGIRKLRGRGLTRREALFLQALVGSPTLIDAFEKAFPKGNLKYKTRRETARRLKESIVSKIGEDEYFEAMGIGRQATAEKIRQLKDAKMVKVFIDPKTAKVIESGEYNDNTTQMNATKLLEQMHKMVDSDKNGGGGTVVVNVVQYAPPNAPPWPGGGRA